VPAEAGWERAGRDRLTGPSFAKNAKGRANRPSPEAHAHILVQKVPQKKLSIPRKI